MKKLNAFDERYAEGIAFDDDELLYTIRLLGLSIEFNDDDVVCHQHHNTIHNNNSELINKNRLLFHNITRKENNILVNSNKIIL